MFLKNSITIKAEQHPFHLVKPSPWPFLVSQLLFLIVILYTFTVLHKGWYSNIDIHDTLILSLTCTFFVDKIIPLYVPFLGHCGFARALWILLFLTYIYSWFADIVTEAVYEGQHTEKVQQGLRLGMVLFILSEVMFFFSFFWAFFHMSIATPVFISSVWAPFGVEAVSPWNLPFLNTLILLFSGATVTWAHHSILSGNRDNILYGLFFTVLLGIIFTALQIFEYQHTKFTLSTGSYGSIFFVATGFHGFHVMLGTVFLTVCFFRELNYHFNKDSHFGFEAAAWYWHFVDVVWLFLFIMVYWWSF